MKQIVQNYKEGTLKLEEVPEPVLKPGGVLVQTYHSLISAGTEKMKVDDSKRSYLGMAKARPDKVRQVLETLQQVGPLATYRKVMNRLDSFTPLGYSLAGRVIAVGRGVSDFRIGDLVACGGAELANHAEINWIPLNLCCAIPKVRQGVEGDGRGYLPTEQAAFTTVGAIAMQGVRQAGVQVGENVAVIGLGLVGLLACQILKAAGCNVFGIDLDAAKVELALKTGVDAAVRVGEADAVQMAAAFSGGYGMDAVLVTTGTKSNDPIVLAGTIARDRGTIVDVGINKMDIPWQLYYSKELVLKQSRSYGPGRYDPNYEQKGQDYPVGYVRWTEKRNMQSFLELMAGGKIDVTPLITHRFDFVNADRAYEVIAGKRSQLFVGIVLKYDVGDAALEKSRISLLQVGKPRPAKGMALGMIGAGNFARTMLLPHLDGPKVRLVGIATATGISGKDTARKFGFECCTTDYGELLKNDAINTIFVTTRHHLHGRLVLEALRAGKHVYTEKPLCLKEEELQEIGETYGAVAGGGDPRLLMVGFNRRYAPFVKQMKSFFSGRSEPMIMHYRVNAGFKEKSDWYQDRTVGGGRIIGEVCHFIDTFQYLTDALPLTVFAQSIKTENQAVTLEDNVIITLRFSDGSIGSITYLANGDPRFPKEYVEVFCENRVAVMNNFSSLTTMANGKRKVKKSMLQDKGHKEEMKTVIRSVCEGEPFPISFESLYATTLATFRIHDSLENDRVMTVEPSAPGRP